MSKIESKMSKMKTWKVQYDGISSAVAHAVGYSVDSDK